MSIKDDERQRRFNWRVDTVPGLSGVQRESAKKAVEHTLKKSKYFALQVKIKTLLMPYYISYWMGDLNNDIRNETSNNLFSLGEIVAWNAIDTLRYLALGLMAISTISSGEVSRYLPLVLSTTAIFALSPVIGINSAFSKAKRYFRDTK